MKRLVVTGVSLLVAAAGWAQEIKLLPKPEILPLALEDGIEFRKVITELHDPALRGGASNRGVDPMITFQRKFRDHGAITRVDRDQRKGHYYTFFWRANRPADLTLRLEYRQDRTGPYVQAREIALPAARGSGKTSIQVTGDDYLWEGRVTAWRALLVENGKVVALTSSFLWN